MSDQFTEQLSAYLDGELDARARARLEAHLDGCADCAAVLADLRAIVAAAPEYVGREPSADLWPGIEARMAGGARTRGRKDAIPGGDDLMLVRRSAGPPVRLSARPPVRRFSLPELLAASLVMAALGGGSVWLALRERESAPAGTRRIAVAPPVDTAIVRPADSATVRPPAGPPDRVTARPPDRLTAQVVRFADADYDRAVRDLERALESGRGRLDSTTVATIEQSLRQIDAAIAQARAAIQRDPANAYLSRQIASNMRRKLDLLRVAVNAINARI